MLFNSAVFPFFLIAALGLYYGFSWNLRIQNLVLVGLSYTFYGYWDWRFLALLVASTLVDYLVGLKLGSSQDPAARRLFLGLSLGTNLGLLGFFKYFNFFVDSFQTLLGGSGGNLDIVLPIGISFYTFQSMSYSLDIYRGKLEPTRDLIGFACYVAFFPQLVAGPIERATRFLPQVLNRRQTTLEQWNSGVYLILWGLYLKVFVGDGLTPVVDPTFANPGAASSGDILLSCLGFTFQIYADFAGYSLIARGIARLMGFELCLNFNLPYFALTPLEFWRRWHISLSTWLRDYLYIPLGGNRVSSSITYRNLMITMVLGGLWHGSQWTFVVWGVYHGLLLAVYRAVPFLGERPAGTSHPQPWVRGLSVAFWTLVTFALIVIGLTIFRADRLADLGVILPGLLNSPWQLASDLPEAWRNVVRLLFRIGPLVMADLAAQFLPVSWFKRAPWPLRTIWYLFLFYSIVWFGGGYGVPFVYFQF